MGERIERAGTAAAARLWERPLPVALGSIAALTLAGWAVLIAEATARGGGAQAFLEALCAPAAILDAPSLEDALLRVAVSAGLWVAMAVAMMLPTASALLVTYAERAEAERLAGRSPVSPLVLGAGYLAAWVVVAVLAALAQTAASAALGGVAIPDRLLGVLAGIALGGAGLYQFTAFKLACLMEIGDPFRRLGERWIERPAAVFRLGLDQGRLCVGCCAAMMGVLVALGAMNLVWMAAFSAVMAAEKMAASERAARLVGAALLLAGAVVALDAVGLGTIGAYLLG